MRELKKTGYRMAMLTNNVREWEPLWRSMLPVDEIFETVVDSGFVGCR
jgi:putative hydrolase of the HAD superfamily